MAQFELLVDVQPLGITALEKQLPVNVSHERGASP